MKRIHSYTIGAESSICTLQVSRDGECLDVEVRRDRQHHCIRPAQSCHLVHICTAVHCCIPSNTTL